MRPPDEGSDAFERLWELAEQLDAESRERLADALSGDEPMSQSEITDLFDQLNPVDRADFRDALEEELGYGETT